MGRVLIIGAGGVGNVVVKKCAQVPQVFTDICLISRTLDKCKKIQQEIKKTYQVKIRIAQVDADKVAEMVTVIKAFKKKGIMAVLGCGFDPGVTNIFCAYAQKHLYDTIKTIDILDANAGTHGHPFATNFNPEINIREVTQIVRHWKKGTWIETPAILDPKSVLFIFNYPVAGHRESYLLYHEEL